MNELFESLDINDEKKVVLSEAFDKAVLAKSVELMDEHVETKVEEAKEVLEEEYAEKVENLEDTLDGYMTSVVEEFVAGQETSFTAQIQDEKAKKLLEMFDAMLTVAGVTMSDISESRSDRDIAEDANSLENQLKRSEDRMAELHDDLIESRKEADKFLKAGIIAETKDGLTMVESDKFERLAEMVTFERTASYSDALDTIKESIIDSRDESFNESTSTTVSTAGQIKLPGEAFKQTTVDVAAATDFSAYV